MAVMHDPYNTGGDFPTRSRFGIVSFVTGALDAFLDAERDRLPLFLPVLMGTGVTAYFGLRVEPPLWPVALGAVMSVAALRFGWRVTWARIVAASLAAGCAGFLSAGLATRRALPPVVLPHHAVVVVGRVRAVDVMPDGGRRLTLDAATLDGGPRLARWLRVRLRGNDPLPIADGETVRLRALLRAPSPPPYPGGWDTRRDAFFSGLAGSGFALGPASEVADPPGGRAVGVAAWWQSVRDRIAERLRAGLPGTDGAVAATLLVGISTAIPEQDRAAFTDSGLAHLLAVAGLHIGIVMGLVLGAVRTGLALSERAALRLPAREIAFAAALAAGGLYLLATGAHVPIVRSFCMATLATVAILLGRRAISMRGLAVAATAILLLWPEEVTGVSFQMSFAAVASLIAGYEIARPLFARLSGNGIGRRIGLHLAALGLTSLLAGLASMPYAAFHFGRIQLYFVAANLVAVPLTASWIMPWGLLSLALMPLGLEHWALVPMGWGIGLVLRTGRLVSAVPGAVALFPQLPLGFLFATSAGIALLCLLRTRVRLAGVLLVAAGLLAGAAARPPDLVVSDDAQLIALPGPGAIAIEKGRGVSRYTIEAYQRLWALPADPVRLPRAGVFRNASCTDTVCRIAVRRATVLIVRDPGAPVTCVGAALVVSPRPLHGECSGRTRIDRFAVWRDGAFAAWFGPDGSVRLASDRDADGVRPWTEAATSTRKSRPDPSRLPVAAADP